MENLFTFAASAPAPSVDVTAARTAIVEGAKTVTENMSGTVTDILPYAISLISVVLVITFGIKIVKRFTGKA